jgi:hypothetical protein
MKIKTWTLAALSATIIAAKAETFVVTITYPHDKIVAYANKSTGWSPTVQEGTTEAGEPILVANPVSAGVAAKHEVETFLNEHLARFNVAGAIEQLDIQKQATISAVRAAVAQGVSITVEE